MGKTLWKSQNVSLNGFFRGKHHPAPAVYTILDGMFFHSPQPSTLIFATTAGSNPLKLGIMNTHFKTNRAM